ncbi:hypothetical protein BKA14_004220 [Actinoplanes abujensis]|uniref:Uncharacterized protein n=1 Tax=Paractinoplanes abujensis TaxID=882441 RepID=A0A7W7G2Q7_9ACTN|nr:hypothetical protein [Actinoplanes abujensis]
MIGSKEMHRKYLTLMKTARRVTGGLFFQGLTSVRAGVAAWPGQLRNTR